MLYYLALIIVIVGGDQLVKLWAVKFLAPGGSVTAIPGLLNLTYAENRGAAFSILEGRRFFFVLITLVMLVLMAYLLHKGIIRGVFGKLGACFVAAGALGNVIDRIFRGFVVDLFDLQFMQFAIFNVADIFISLGGAMLVIYFLFLEGKIVGGEKIDAKANPDC